MLPAIPVPMPTPIILHDAYVEEKAGRLIAVFVFNARPSRHWIMYFRERAWYSVFDAASARFARGKARVDLLRREDLGPLTQSMRQFIEGANLDVELSGLA